MPVADIAAVVLGYLIGSISFGYLIARTRGVPDIRLVGNGNPGARNVWHLFGPFWGGLVFVLDAAKGAIPILIARALEASTPATLLAGLATILGHDFPLYLGFRGGKGLATTIGVLAAITPLPMLAALAAWLVVHLILRNLDRSTYVIAIGAIVFPGALGYRWEMGLYALALFLIILLRKVQDRARQRQIWQASGWDGIVENDWYGDAPSRGGRPDETEDSPPPPQG